MTVLKIHIALRLMCKPLNKLHKQNYGITLMSKADTHLPLIVPGQHFFLFVLILMVSIIVCARVCRLPEREVHSCRGALTEDSFNAPVVPIAEMSRTDDPMLSQLWVPGGRCRVSTPHQATQPQMQTGSSAATVIATSRDEAASSKQRTLRPRCVPAPRPARAPASAAAALTAAVAAAAATEHLGDPASQSTCCSGRWPAQPPIDDVYFLRTTSWIRWWPATPYSSLPCPHLRTRCALGDARARVPTGWPGRPRPGCLPLPRISSSCSLRGEWQESSERQIAAPAAVARRGREDRRSRVENWELGTRRLVSGGCRRDG